MVDTKQAYGLITGVVGIGIALIMIAAIMPVALRTQANVNQTYYTGVWGTGISTVYFTLIPIIFVVVLVLGLLGWGMHKRNQ